jgi:hypothetical protein
MTGSFLRSPRAANDLERSGERAVARAARPSTLPSGLFATLPYEDARHWFVTAARTRAREPHLLYVAHDRMLELAQVSESYRRLLSRADLVVDSSVELFPRVFAEGHPLRTFVYADDRASTEAAARALEALHPATQVVGILYGEATPSAGEIVSEACPDVLLVARNDPLQELWIDENRMLFDVGVVASVQGLVDTLLDRGRTRRQSYFARLFSSEG